MSDLLLEIGCEELPASYIDPAVSHLQAAMAKELTALGLSYGAVQTFGTPRRLVVIVRDVAEKQEDVVTEVTGPKVELAFDAAGKLTAVGQGFLRARGIEESAAYKKTTPKGEVIAAQLHQTGKAASALLVPVLESLIANIPFPKTMRWDDSGVQFARPVRWLLCLLGKAVLPVQFGHLHARHETCGHRFLSPDFRSVSDVDDYLVAMPKHFVMLDGQMRKAHIAEQAQLLAEKRGGRCRSDAALLDTVKNLVEYPWPLLGEFDEQFLSIPKEVLISEMREHQKYFACESEDDKNLLPVFVVVAGSQPIDDKQVAAGHARVLRARFEDGAFYYNEDCKTPLRDRVPALANLLFQRELGSMLAKSQRIEELVKTLQTVLKVKDKATALRAAQLCKADLLTGVVGEFPELQGCMGRIYAKLSGESDAVATAIEQHYWPKGAHDQLPQTEAAALIAIADRIDTLVGIIGIGRMPKGSADPFGLRRAGIAVCRIVMEQQLPLSLRALVTQATQQLQPHFNVAEQEVVEHVLEFIRARCRGVLLEMAQARGESESALVIDGAMSAGSDDLADLHARVVALIELRQQNAQTFDLLCATLKRAGNIVQKAGTLVAFDASKLEHPSEIALWKAAQAVTMEKNRDYVKLLAQIAALKPLLDTFFEDVMVMADDEALKQARLGMLQHITGLSKQVADFTRM